MRFALMTGYASPQYLAACYELDAPGILFTSKLEDACSYPSFERAVDTARAINDLFGYLPIIVAVDH